MIFERVNAWCISMLAPPGYANTASTPSRSRHLTRMSAPRIGACASAPSSTIGAAFLDWLLAVAFACLFIGNLFPSKDNRCLGREGLIHQIPPSGNPNSAVHLGGPRLPRILFGASPWPFGPECGRDVTVA